MPHDRVAVDAGKPLDRANRVAFDQHVKDGASLLGGKDAHGGRSPLGAGRARMQMLARAAFGR